MGVLRGLINDIYLQEISHSILVHRNLRDHRHGHSKLHIMQAVECTLKRVLS